MQKWIASCHFSIYKKLKKKNEFQEGKNSLAVEMKHDLHNIVHPFIVIKQVERIYEWRNDDATQRTNEHIFIGKYSPLKQTKLKLQHMKWRKKMVIVNYNSFEIDT